MKSITTIEKDCIYIWLDKPEKGNDLKLKVRELLIGEDVGSIVKENGIAKFKKFFHKDLVKERSVAYKFEKRFTKEPNIRWFIISNKELKKSNIAGCKEFDEIKILEHSQFVTPKSKRPFKKGIYYYLVMF